jgi:hypothetical protein
MTAREISHKIFSAETLIPAGVVCAAIMPLVLATWAAATAFSGFKSELAQMKDSVNSLGKYQWTYAMERETWKEFSRLNPGLQTPNVKEVWEQNR